MNAPRSRPRRVARWLVLGTIALGLGWLVLVNLALWTGIVARAVSAERERGTILLHHGFAWCVWPTRVHLSDVDLRVDRYGWQLGIAADSAVIDLDLFALASRRFSADHLAMEGVALTFRTKREEADPDTFATYGPIAELDAPVRAPERPPAPAPDDAWAIDLRHMEADLVRVWVNGVRAELRGHVSTGITSVSGRMYGIAPTRVRIDEGIVFVDDTLATTSLSGRVALMVAPYSHIDVAGADAIRQVTALAELRADLTGLRALETWLPEKAPRISGGGGPVQLDLAMWSGVLTDGHVKYRTPSVVVAQGDTTIRSALSLDVAIDSGTPRAEAEVKLRKVSARGQDGDEPWLRAETITAAATIAGLDLAGARPRLLAATAVAPEVELLDLGVLGRVGKSARVQSGRGEATVDLAYDHADGLSGKLTASARQVAVSTTQGVRVRADGRVTTQVRSDPDLHRVLLHPFAARIDDVSIRSERGSSEGFWARVGAGRVRWDRQAGRFDIEVLGEIDDLQPLLAQANARSSMANVMESLEGLGTREPLEIHARATIGDDTIDVTLERAERPTLDLSGRWRRVGDDTRAAILLGRLRVGLVKDGEDAWNPVLSVDDGWLPEHERWVGQL